MKNVACCFFTSLVLNTAFKFAMYDKQSLAL